MSDVARIRNGLQIRGPKLKSNPLNEARIKACLSRFDNGSYTTLQFLRAVSHAVGAHTESLQPSPDSDSSEKTRIRCRRRQLQLVRRRDGRISDR